MVYTLVDLSLLENIIIISLLTLTILYLIISLLRNYKCKYKTIIDKLLEVPVPLCIINISTNKIIDGNNLMKEMFNIVNIKNTDISSLNIFDKFETYLEIKNICKHSETKIHSRILTIEINKQKIHFRADFTYTEIGYKKYMVLTLINNTDIMNYIKKLGILANVVDKSTEGIIVTRYENGYNEYPKIIYTNNTLQNITGYKKSEIIDKPLSVLFETNIDEKSQELLKANLKELKPTILEYQYTKKNGTICWILSEIVPITKKNIFKSLTGLDKNRCLDDIYEEDINDVDIYITLYQRDITNIKEMDSIPKIYSEKLHEILKYKDYYIDIIDNLLAIYNRDFKLSSITNDEILELITPLIGKAMHSDRCFITNIYNKDGKKYIKLLKVWYKDDKIKKEIGNNLLLLNNSTFEDINAYETYSYMITNKIYELNANKIKTTTAKQLLEANNIKSSIRCPIYKDDNLIGMIVADDFEDTERDWQDSKKLIQVIANNINNLI